MKTHNLMFAAVALVLMSGTTPAIAQNADTSIAAGAATATAACPPPPPPSPAATVDYLLRLDGIQGESTREGHKGEIELLSWSLHDPKLCRPAAIEILKRIDKSSPLLFKAVARGEHIPSATLTVEKRGERPVPYLKYELKDVVISSYHATSGDVVPTDQFSINYGKITTSYRQQKPDGSLGDPISFCWDVMAKRVC